MALLDVPADPALHLVDGSASGRIREQGSVNIFRRVSSRLSDDDSAALVIPLQYRTRSNTESMPDFRRDRDLALSGDLGMGERHTADYHGNARR
jgi:hypothetical protein